MLRTVTENGFVMYRSLAPNLSTIELAQELGTILDIPRLLPSSGIPVVQSLRPRATMEVGQNQYSGHYGLGAFPVHTDLAHWALPPRYLLLRCIAGFDDVFTCILPWTQIVETLGKSALGKAVFVVRNRRNGSSGLVRAMSQYAQTDVFRWDQVFLRPLNQQAHELAKVMADPKWNCEVINIQLRQPGDAVLIDNWRMLHGRSAVPWQSKARHLERVYLSEVFR